MQEDDQLEDDGPQTAVLSLSEIQAEERRLQRLLDAGKELISETRETIAKLDAALDAGAARLADLEDEADAVRPSER